MNSESCENSSGGSTHDHWSTFEEKSSGTISQSSSGALAEEHTAGNSYTVPRVTDS